MIVVGALAIVVAVWLAGRMMKSRRRELTIRRQDTAIVEDLRRQKPVTVRQLTEQLDGEKAAFLDEIEHAVHDYIAAQGTKCLGMIERGADDGVLAVWNFNLTSIEYIKRLIAFCLQHTYDGHALDSQLTDPVIAIVVEHFKQLYQSNGHVIAGDLLRNEALAGCVAQNVRASQALKMVSGELRERAADLVLDQLQQAIERKTGVVISTSAAVTVAANVATFLYAHFGSSIGILVAKSLAVPAVQKALLIVMKKLIITTIMAKTAEVLAAKLGVASLHAAMMAILIPLILAVVAWDISRFPGELGHKVAKQVRNELEGRFDEVNHAIVEGLFDNIVDSFVDAGVNSVVEGWIAVPDVSGGLQELAGALSSAA